MLMLFVVGKEEGKVEIARVERRKIFPIDS
jgi:hypothetical protein